MKLAAIIVTLSLAIGVQAQPFTNVFTQTPNQLIPDANPTGFYSTNFVSGVEGSIQNLTVLLDISGGWNGDLYVYLSFGDGIAVLLNRIGRTNIDFYGSGSSGMNIALNDAAATDIHLYSGNEGDLITGTWQPDGRQTDPQQVVDNDPRTAMLSSFYNLDPNGAWTLFVADYGTQYQSTLVSWSLEFVTVPEPTTLQLLAAFGGFAAAGAWRRRK